MSTIGCHLPTSLSAPMCATIRTGLLHGVGPSPVEDHMSEAQRTADQSLAQQTSPYGYAYWEWVAREDPEYARARIPLSDLSVGEGKALAINPTASFNSLSNVLVLK